MILLVMFIVVFAVKMARNVKENIMRDNEEKK